MKFYYSFKCYLSTRSKYILCADAGHAQRYKRLCGQADAMHRQGTVSTFECQMGWQAQKRKPSLITSEPCYMQA